MRSRIAVVVAAWAFVWATVAPRHALATPGEDPQVALQKARVAYERGEYQGAVDVLSRLLYPSVRLTSEEAVVEAHKVLALSYLFQRRPVDAENEVNQLYVLRPQFELDPIVDPPQAVSFFSEVKSRQTARLEEIRRRQREADEAKRRDEEKKRELARQKAERVYVDRVVERHSRLIATLPFGVGQFQNGHRKKGYFFLVSELIVGAVSVSAFIAIQQKFAGGGFGQGEAGLARALTGLELGAGTGFWALAIAGIIDSHVYFRRQVEVNTKERPADSRPVPDGPKQSLLLAPIVAPGTFGASVLLTF